MNSNEAAAALGKSSWWVRRQCASGTLRASYYGGSWNIPPDAVAAYIAAHTNTPQPATTRHRRRRTA